MAYPHEGVLPKYKVDQPLIETMETTRANLDVTCDSGMDMYDFSIIVKIVKQKL